MKTTIDRPKAAVILMSAEILAMCHDANYVMAQNPKASVRFHTHLVDMENDVYGAEQTILDILKENGAVFPSGIENTEFRAMALSASLTAEDILLEFQSRFTAGTKRYSYASLHTFLSQHLAKVKCTKAGVQIRPALIGKIRMSAAEDSDRDCDKPRCKWYAIQ